MAIDPKRLQQLEDQLALERHINLYQRAADTNDWEAYADLLTEDMVFEFLVDDAASGTGVIPIKTRVYKGIEEGLPYLKSLHVPFVKTQHLITNRYFDIDGDTAEGRANILFAGVPDPKYPKRNVRFGCRYTWKFRRTERGWKTASTMVEKVWEDS